MAVFRISQAAVASCQLLYPLIVVSYEGVDCKGVCCVVPIAARKSARRERGSADLCFDETTSHYKSAP